MTESLASILAQLHALPWQFNPRAVDAEIQRMASELNCPLDESLAALYRDHNGVQSHIQHRFLMRLMSIDEVIQTYHMMEEFRGLHPDQMRADVRMFWSDENSNYAGMHIAGPLTGKLCIYDHEDVDFAPRFRSVASYYAHLIPAVLALDIEDEDHLVDWSDMASDYPLLAAAPETDGDDLILALEFIARYETIHEKTCENRPERHFLAFTGMNLLPFAESERLLPLTVAADDEDMWIQAYACELLGKRRYVPAIPRLKDVALHGTHNAIPDALMALGRMHTPEAKAALLEIAPHFVSGWEYMYQAALREVDRDA